MTYNTYVTTNKHMDNECSDAHRLICEMENRLPEPASEGSLYEMACFLRSRHRELPSNIWVSSKNANHEPRIKIQRSNDSRMQSNDTFSMTISDSPRAIGAIGPYLSSEDITYFKDFVLKNKDALLAYWNEELDTSDLVNQLTF